MGCVWFIDIGSEQLCHWWKNGHVNIGINWLNEMRDKVTCPCVSHALYFIICENNIVTFNNVTILILSSDDNANLFHLVVK